MSWFASEKGTTPSESVVLNASGFCIYYCTKMLEGLEGGTNRQTPLRRHRTPGALGPGRCIIIMYGDRRGACQAVLSRVDVETGMGNGVALAPHLLLAALSLSGAWVWSLEAAHAQELAKLQATVSIQALRMSELVDKLNASELGEGSSSWRPLKSNVMMWKSNVMMCSAIWSAQNLHPFAAQPTEPTVTAAAGRRSGSPGGRQRIRILGSRSPTAVNVARSGVS